MDFLDSVEKLSQAAEGIFESHRRGEDYLKQRKWVLAAFKRLFDLADSCDIFVDDDVARMLRQRAKKD